MNFKKTKLNSKRRTIKRKLQEINPADKIKTKLGKTKNHVIEKLPKAILIIVAIIIPLFVVVRAYEVIKQTNIGSSITNRVIKTVGKNLPMDADGYTNFLLLGTGTQNHGGRDLTDTMILASFHQENKNAILTSIPRDLFYKHANYYGQKVNSLYATAYYENGESEEGYQAISEAISDITNREIHRYLRVNFDTLVNIVDSLDGITINVEKSIYDTSYPTKNFGYQIFKLDTGLQTLDGATALKYVRSRHESSDFDRSRRQQKVIFALKEKAQSSNILNSPEKIKELYAVLEEGIDTNLELLEIVELASLGMQFNKEDLISIQLNNEPSLKGGLLYTPPRYLYNDIFVLRPLGESFEAIHFLLNLHYDFPQAFQEGKTISIINGTTRNGLASKTGSILTRFGLMVTHLGNADNKPKTTTSLYPRNALVKSQLPQLLNEIIPLSLNNRLPESYQSTTIEDDTDFILELGNDFLPIIQVLSQNQYLPVAPPPPPEEDPEPESNTEPAEQIDTTEILENQPTTEDTDITETKVSEPDTTITIEPSE